MNSKYNFRKLLFLHKLIIQKVLFSKSAGTKNSQLKIENLTFWKLFFSNFHCTGKGLLQNLILFFGKFHFKLWFSMKEFATKSCLLKWAREVKNLLLSAEHIESKRFFFRCEFFIEIWLLNIYWTQNLIFRKILSPQNDLSKSLLSKSAETKNSGFKNWSICRKKLDFKIRFFFQKFPFQNTIFNGKVYFKIMPFKISTQTEKLVVVCGANWVKTFIFQMWIFHRNLISQ